MKATIDALLKRLRIQQRRLIDQPLPRATHVFPAEHGLRVVAVHYVADPDFYAAMLRHRFKTLGTSIVSPEMGPSWT